MDHTPPSGIDSNLYQIAFEFMGECYDIFGSYLDAVHGIECARSEFIQHQKKTVEEQSQRAPDTDWQTFLDGQTVQHMLDEDEKRPSKMLHTCTQLEFKQRLAPKGRDIRMLGNAAITFLYAVWEDEYRERMASALGLEKKSDLKSDVFGDLCKLRNAVVHNGGVATSAVEGSNILRWFKRGDEILLTPEMVDELFDKIDDAVTALCGIER